MPHTPMHRVLLIHQNFPGQFRHLARHLAARPDVDLVCLGSAKAPGLDDIALARCSPHRAPAKGTHPYLRTTEQAVLRGQAVVRRLQRLAQRGFRPDVIVAHPGWGDTLYVRDLFPGARLVHLCEWYYGSAGSDLDFDPEFPTGLDQRARSRTWNAMHLLNLEQCHAAIAPTQWQKSRHPLAYADKIRVAHEGVDTTSFRPDPAASFVLPNGTRLQAGQPIVTYAVRNLEPYRGFHVFMRALQRIQAAHPHCHTVIAGGNGVSYGTRAPNGKTWRETLLAQVRLDPARTHFAGWLGRDQYRRLLQVSAVHVYLTYPFVLSWSMLEAMACGCALVASDTAPVREFVDDGVEGHLVPFHDPAAIANRVVEVLDAGAGASAAMRARARARVLRCAGVGQGVEAYLQMMGLPPLVSAVVRSANDGGSSGSVQREPGSYTSAVGLGPLLIASGLAVSPTGSKATEETSMPSESDGLSRMSRVREGASL